MQTAKVYTEALFGDVTTWGNVLIADGIILTLVVAATVVIVAVGKAKNRKGKDK